MLSEAADQMDIYRAVAAPEYAMLLSPKQLWIYHGDTVARYDLDEITLDQAHQIFERLRRPSVWPTLGRTSQRPAIANPAPNFEHFRIDSPTIAEKISAAEVASTAKEKGATFEEVAAVLFSGLKGVKVKYRNLLGSSYEVDLVLEHSRADIGPLFHDFGRYSLVECKNWSEPMAAKHIRDFKAKLDRARAHLGFVMSRNGVTGAHNGADALREIRAAVDTNGVFLIVVSQADLKAVEAGADFYSLIDDRVDRLRFDF
ncbi:restriction endonuclease [Sorangium sp. So ce1153]|uniref:restriction endonuclease n=1 Tax=Sorangium sp. So ce1153 TaxID=3133333 RepID=UPI003F647168